MGARRYPESGAGQTKLEEDYCDEQSNPCQHGIINDFKLMMMMMMMMMTHWLACNHKCGMRWGKERCIKVVIFSNPNKRLPLHLLIEKMSRTSPKFGSHCWYNIKTMHIHQIIFAYWNHASGLCKMLNWFLISIINILPLIFNYFSFRDTIIKRPIKSGLWLYLELLSVDCVWNSWYFETLSNNFFIL